MENAGIVLELTENTIVTEVYVDIPRRMVFDRKTGVSLKGAGFGWIKDYIGE